MRLFFLLVISIFVYTWLKFRQSIYIHTTLNQDLINQYPFTKKSVSFETIDGETISAWYIPVSNPKAVVILIHGLTEKNGGKALMLPHAAYLSKNNYSTLLLDLRSAGESTGKKIYLGAKEWKDVEAAYDYLHSLPENKNTKIGFLGISMGGATAIIAAGKTQKGDFDIASVPFSSYDEQFSREIEKTHLPVWLFLPFLKLAASIELGSNYSSFDPLKMIGNIHTPVLLFGAKNDQDIDYHQTIELFDQTSEPKDFWLAETGHDIHLEKPHEFEEKVLSFLKGVTEQKR